MTNRIVEAKIILLIWLFSALVVSYSTINAALAIHSNALELIDVDQEQTGNNTELEDLSSSFRLSVEEGSG